MNALVPLPLHDRPKLFPVLPLRGRVIDAPTHNDEVHIGQLRTDNGKGFDDFQLALPSSKNCRHADEAMLAGNAEPVVDPKGAGAGAETVEIDAVGNDCER